MLDDYTKAKFPLDVKWSGGSTVRLFGTMSGRVFGVSFFTYERNGEVTEEFSQNLDWDGQGVYGSSATKGDYPTMNLVPPPALVADRVAGIKAEIADRERRLADMPDAPVEWRSIDERKVKRLSEELEQLS